MRATQEQVRAIVTKIEQNGHFQFLANLACRWSSEKGYEDFDDYIKIIEERMGYLTIHRVTKRPFGIVFRLYDSFVTAKYLKKRNTLNLQISWQ